MLPNPAPWQNELAVQVQEYWFSPVIFTHEAEPQSIPQEPQWVLLLRATHELLQQYPAEHAVPLAIEREQSPVSVRDEGLHVPAEHW